jgi:hypothetical protein
MEVTLTVDLVSRGATNFTRQQWTESGFEQALR